MTDVEVICVGGDKGWPGFIELLEINAAFKAALFENVRRDPTLERS